MPRFDLNLLGALQALLTERNVTRAGDRLHVTQPTMSGMLQRLRYQFGDAILVRVGRNMELTPLGQSLIEPVREALRGIEALSKAEPAFHPATSTRTLSLMASDYCALTFLPRVVRRLTAIAPGIRLDVKPLNLPVERLIAGDVDAFISTDDWSLLDHEGHEDILRSQKLFSDQFVCIAAEDHPLDLPITIEEYLRYPHVEVQMEGILNTIVAASLRRHAPCYRPTYTVAEFIAIPHMLAGTPLIGVVQRRLAQMCRKSVQIKIFAPPFGIPDINETLYWHPRHACDPAHQWFRELLSEVAAKEQGEPLRLHARAAPREEGSLAIVV